jgi:hypothetical protein
VRAGAVQLAALHTGFGPPHDPQAALAVALDAKRAIEQGTELAARL